MQAAKETKFLRFGKPTQQWEMARFEDVLLCFGKGLLSTDQNHLIFVDRLTWRVYYQQTRIISFLLMA